MPGDKEDLQGGELAIPRVIGVAQVLHHDGALGKAQSPGLLDFMPAGRGDSDNAEATLSLLIPGKDWQTYYEASVNEVAGLLP